MTGLLVTYPHWHVYQILATLFFGCMLLFGRLNMKRRNPNGLPLPPGPKGLPLIGNLFDFPTNHQWLVYDEWKKTYGKYFIIDWPLLWTTWTGHLGDMVYFNVLGQDFLILGSLQRTTDLFEKRSLNYSDRMRLPMMVELCVLHSFTSELFKLFLPVPEWSGILPSLFFHTVQHGRNTGVHFKSFSTTMRCSNTNLFKSERSTLFCVDC